MNLSQINRLVPQYNYRFTLSQPANPLDVWTLADYCGTIRLVFVSTYSHQEG